MVQVFIKLIIVLLPTVGCTGVKEAYDLAAASDSIKTTIITNVSNEKNSYTIRKCQYCKTMQNMKQICAEGY